MQSTALIDRLETQLIADVMRVGLPRVLKQQSMAQPTGSSPKCQNLCDQLRSTSGWLSVGRVSELIVAHPQTVRKWIVHEGLPAHKLCGRWKIYGPLAAEWLESKLGTARSAMCTTNSTDNKTISKDLPIGIPTHVQEANIE